MNGACGAPSTTALKICAEPVIASSAVSDVPENRATNPVPDHAKRGCAGLDVVSTRPSQRTPAATTPAGGVSVVAYRVVGVDRDQPGVGGAVAVAVGGVVAVVGIGRAGDSDQGEDRDKRSPADHRAYLESSRPPRGQHFDRVASGRLVFDPAASHFPPRARAALAPAERVRTSLELTSHFRQVLISCRRSEGRWRGRSPRASSRGARPFSGGCQRTAFLRRLLCEGTRTGPG